MSGKIDGKLGTTMSLLVILLSFISSDPSFAYMVGPALRLDQIVQESDVIFKAKAISSIPGEDKWFKKHRGFDTYATQMQVVSVIKGDIPTRKVIFQHYGPANNLGSEFSPQSYEFQVGQSYIVFAKKTDQQSVFRQLWENHRIKYDQGVIIAADDRPVEDQSIKEIVWTELNKLLLSSNPEDVIYAIRQLNEMSETSEIGGGFALDDFDRNRVLDAVSSLMFRKENEIAIAAIKAIGAASPYIYRYNESFWLATIGSGNIPGLSKRNANVKNIGAQRYWRHLVSVADGNAVTQVRSLAILSLGRSGETKIFDHVVRWVNDPEPLIRQAAVILLSDFPCKETSQILTDRSEDKESEVRLGVAHAVGYGQFDAILPLLDKLLQDEDVNVRTAAALSLVSFAPSKAENVLKANIDNQDFRSVFVNALAEKNPEPYPGDLAEIIEKRLEPRNFWGGQAPYTLSWHILFTYIQGQNADLLKTGKLDRSLDALEKTKFWGSSEPRDLYAFYIKHKMIERAQKFRETCKTTISFDMERYFSAVDMEYYGIDTPK